MRSPAVAAAIAAIAVLVLSTSRAAADPVTEKTPAVSSPDTTRARTADFLFAHHFRVIGDKAINVPTFLLGIGILPWLSIGTMYSTNADVGRNPNELQPFAKVRLLRQETAQIDLGLVGGYNSAPNSGDGAVLVRRSVGPLMVLGALRGFTAGYGFGGATAAAAVGANLRLTRYLHLVADGSHVLGAQDWSLIRATSNRFGYSAGVAFDIPNSPHSMSLYATNISTHTLQGASRGSRDFQIGFEFDVPLTSARRWGQIFAPAPETTPPSQAEGAPVASRPADVPAGAPVVEVSLVEYAFSPEEITVAPGTLVRWVNRDEVVHTITDEENAWDSGDVPPNGTFSRRFDEPGRHPYVCTLHADMRGAITVEAR